MTPRPLKLPRLTILYGQPKNGQYELARAMMELDNDMEAWDAQEPIVNVMREFFFPSSVDAFMAEFPKSPPIKTDLVETWDDFANELERFFRHTLGINVFAELAKRRLGNFHASSRAVIWGIQVRDEVTHLRSAYGDDNVLVVNCASLMHEPPVKSIQLPFPPELVAERMSYLRRELGDLFE